jgi:1-acyl-sn-glycerol-3-phosphate acyltransferase
MLTRARQQRPNTPLWRLAAYSTARGILLALLTVIYKMRAYGTDRVPARGPVLLVANHQSYLDPPAIGSAIRQRHLDYIARAGLFQHPALAKMFTAFNSIPISEEGGDAGAIKEVLRRLDAGRAVLIFPEGTRSPDGAMRPFKRGVWLLVKRARCPVVPVAVEGCFDAWPRDRKTPSVWGHRVAVMVGEPVAHDDLMGMGPDRSLEFLSAQIDQMRLSLRARLREQTRGRFPAAGPGDQPRRAGSAGLPSAAGDGELAFRSAHPA